MSSVFLFKHPAGITTSLSQFSYTNIPAYKVNYFVTIIFLTLTKLPLRS